MSEELNNENQINNDSQEEIKQDEKEVKNNNSKLLKYILILIVVFLGTFAAVYTVVDMNMNKLGLKPLFVTFKEAQKMLDSEAKFIEKFSPLPVRIEEKKDKYIITVNLKNFNNNPDNIKIETLENGITISGEMKKEKDGEIKESSFYQNVMFPNKIDTEKISKEAQGNNMIIILPFEKED